MTARPRIYLDHCSTSWPKSPAVIDAMSNYLRDVGATSGRGAYRSAERASAIVAGLRSSLAKRVDAPEPACVSLHGGCTLALNAAIAGLVPGMVGTRGEILVGAAEHNAVSRPVHHAAAKVGASVVEVPCDRWGTIDVAAFESRLCERTRMVAIAHASNVTGAVQPIAAIGQRLNEWNRSNNRRVLFLCDAAQTLGTIPISMLDCGIDVLAAPAHKGCGGPPGIAMLAILPWLYDQIEPTVWGGTGHDSRSPEMPTTMPQRLEPGTLNLPAIAGWLAAMELAEKQPIDREHLAALSARLHEGLGEIASVRLVSRGGPLPIASLVFDNGTPPAEAAMILDAEFGIEVRAGLHCSPSIHEFLGTSDVGTLRISGGASTTFDEIDQVVTAIGEIAEA